MVCIYCGTKTMVTNSREQQKIRQTWRRRRCPHCNAVFTTLEASDLAGSFRVVAKDGTLVPFSRDHLYMSLVGALGHRSDAVEAATALTATTISMVVKTAQEGRIERRMIIEAARVVLNRFDTVAAVQYTAYHPI